MGPSEIGEDFREATTGFMTSSENGYKLRRSSFFAYDYGEFWQEKGRPSGLLLPFSLEGELGDVGEASRLMGTILSWISWLFVACKENLQCMYSII